MGAIDVMKRAPSFSFSPSLFLPFFQGESKRLEPREEGGKRIPPSLLFLLLWVQNGYHLREREELFLPFFPGMTAISPSPLAAAAAAAAGAGASFSSSSAAKNLDNVWLIFSFPFGRWHTSNNCQIMTRGGRKRRRSRPEKKRREGEGTFTLADERRRRGGGDLRQGNLLGGGMGGIQRPSSSSS